MPKFLMIGGFLGAGKTTTIARLAAHYRSLGKKVAIVTNDQAADLVDTHLLRAHGFSVGEVAGSCFCCNFNELTDTIERLSQDQRPDFVIAEPVGSCTDLVATVLRPLEHIYQQPMQLAPYGVIIKPSHGLKILDPSVQAGFSPQAEYIFLKQLEEADFIILNRIDDLPPDKKAKLVHLIAERFPNHPCLHVSAATGEGFEALIHKLEQPDGFALRQMHVDYDVYAAGEADLGWLNAQATLHADAPFSLDDLVMQLVASLASLLTENDSEIAHLKVIGMADGQSAVANQVSSDTPPRLSLASHWHGKNAELVINARVAIDPESLSSLLSQAVSNLSHTHQLRCDVRGVQAFRPGRPVPTHRLA